MSKRKAKAVQQEVVEAQLEVVEAQEIVEVAEVVEVQELPKLELVESVSELVAEHSKPVKDKGIGKFIINEILTTPKTNKEILETVLKTFQGSVTTMACIAWYKSKLRREGLIAQRVLKKTVESTETQVV